MAQAQINVWRYARQVYLIGRSTKQKGYSVNEKIAILTFINGIRATRPTIVPNVNIKKGNAVGVVQNDHSLGKMVQVIGRNLKVLFPTVAEKNLCDALFLATDPRRYEGVYGGFVVDRVSSSSTSSSSSEVVPEESSSSSEVVREESSSSSEVVPEESSSSSEVVPEESSSSL